MRKRVEHLDAEQIYAFQDEARELRCEKMSEIKVKEIHFASAFLSGSLLLCPFLRY